ncbi:hypothetical protein [Petrachloros mirabilis]
MAATLFFSLGGTVFLLSAPALFLSAALFALAETKGSEVFIVKLMTVATAGLLMQDLAGGTGTR